MLSTRPPAPPEPAAEAPRSPSAAWTGVTSAAVALGCAGLALAILVATTLLELPLLAPLAAAAALGLPVLLLRPVLFLVLVTVVEVGNLSGVAALNGVPRLETALLGLGLLAVAVAFWRGRVRPGWSPFLTAALVYLAVQATSLLSALDTEIGLGVVAETGKALMWPVIVIVLVVSAPRAPRAMAQAIVLTLATLAGLTAVQEFVLGNGTELAGLANLLAADIGGVTARHAGPQEDANFWGRVLVLGLPFALSLARMAASWLGRAFWMATALCIGGGMVLTGSRGTLLAGAVVVCLWALLTGGRVAKSLVLAPLVLGLGLLVPGVGSRLLTLASIDTDNGLAVTDPSLDGRLAAQRVALEVLTDHPVLGVGPGGFLPVAPEYLQRLSLNATPLAPHNQYLEAGAEGGLLGLAAWLLLLGAAVFVAHRARLLARTGGPAVETAAPVALSNAVLAALAGWAVASIFLHLATFRTFLFVAALGAALDLRARHRVRQLASVPSGELPADPGEGAGRRVGPRLVAALVVGLLVLAGGLWGSEPRRTVWSATTAMQFGIDYASGSTSPAYDLETLSRADLVRTLAGIAATPRFAEEGRQRVEAFDVPTDGYDVEVTGSVRSALVAFTASGPDAGTAQLMALETRAAAAEYIEGVSPLYLVQTVPGEPVVVRSQTGVDRRWALLPLSAAVLGALVYGGVFMARRRAGGAGTAAPSADPPAPA
jgi:O-antigen ligase